MGNSIKNPKKIKKLTIYLEMHQEMGPLPARPPERGVRGAATPPEEKKEGRINENSHDLQSTLQTQGISYYASEL